MRARAPHVLDAVPDPAPMLERFERDLRELVLRSREKAKRVIVVRQPWFEKELSPEEERHMWNFGQGRPYREEVRTYYSHRVVWELMRQVDQRTARIVAELGAEEVELMSVLERSLEIYYDELHHTPRGCREVGRAVAEVILRRERGGARSSSPARLMPTRE